MRIRHIGALAVLSLAVAACSTQNVPEDTTGSLRSQAYASNSATGKTASQAANPQEWDILPSNANTASSPRTQQTRSAPIASDRKQVQSY